MQGLQSNLARGCSTMFMWGAAIAIVAIASPFVDSSGMALVVAISMLVALLGTVLLWGLPEIARIYEMRLATRDGDAYLPEKTKRQHGDKLALLMELMDEDEREAFKEALKQRALADTGYDDGELPYGAATLESLMRDEDAGNRLRQ